MSEALVQVVDRLVNATDANTEALSELSAGFSRCPSCRNPRIHVRARTKNSKRELLCPTCMRDRLIELDEEPYDAGRIVHKHDKNPDWREDEAAKEEI